MAKSLNILFAASEVAPLVVTGGLADVAGALPKALHAAGHDVRVVMPCYRSVAEEHRGEAIGTCIGHLGGKEAFGLLRESRLPGTDIPLYLIEHEGYFGRAHPYQAGAYEFADNPERFAFFCAALLDAIPQTGWCPDILHAHDWHTATLPAYLRARYQGHPTWGRTKSIFTIHNLAYQGRYGREQYGITGLPWEYFHPEGFEYHGDVSLMKGGIAFADRLSTVSPRYADEIQTIEYGCGLDGLLRRRREALRGILNGVDYGVWHPSADKHLPAQYTAADPTGKAACRTALLAELGLPERGQPLLAMVSRLAWQKGIDLALAAIPAVIAQGYTVIVLGSGEPALEHRLGELAGAYPADLRVLTRFDVGLSHRIEAGADFFLMPSRYEPCGLSQIYSLAYGTVPIVRATGGLCDTVRGLRRDGDNLGDATGFRFVPQTHQAIERATAQAREVFAQPEAMAQLRDNGMREDFSWARSSTDYEALYREALAA